MSQRECSGFNWPGFSIPAGEPVAGGPETRAATRGNWSSLVRSEPSGFVPVVDIPGVSFQSLALAVGQLAISAASYSVVPGLPLIM